jgi:hypothetical protein
VLASRPVIDLLAGSGIRFADRGQVVVDDRPLAVSSVHHTERT